MPVLRDNSLSTFSYCYVFQSAESGKPSSCEKQLTKWTATAESRPRTQLSHAMRAAFPVSISARDTRLRSPPETLQEQAKFSKRNQTGKEMLGSPTNHLGSDPSVQRVRHSKGREKSLSEICNVFGTLALLRCRLFEREGETEGLAHREQRGMDVVLAVEDELALVVPASLLRRDRSIVDVAFNFEEGVGGVGECADCEGRSVSITISSQ